MIDVLLLLLIVGYTVIGFRQGLLISALSLVGFLGGGALAMWLLPALLSQWLGGSNTLRTSAVLVGGVLLAASAGQAWSGRSAPGCAAWSTSRRRRPWTRCSAPWPAWWRSACSPGSSPARCAASRDRCRARSADPRSSRSSTTWSRRRPPAVLRLPQPARPGRLPEGLRLARARADPADRPPGGRRREVGRDPGGRGLDGEDHRRRPVLQPDPGGQRLGRRSRPGGDQRARGRRRAQPAGPAAAAPARPTTPRSSSSTPSATWRSSTCRACGRRR